jgi:hypothetical protein
MFQAQRFLNEPSSHNLCLNLWHNASQSLIIDFGKRDLIEKSAKRSPRTCQTRSRINDTRALTTSPVPPPPKSVPSARLAAITFLTRSSQTPDQFHSPGLLAPPGCAARGDRLPSLLASPFSDLAGDCARFSPRTFARWLRHACQALGFAAEDNGTASVISGAEKTRRRYCNT